MGRNTTGFYTTARYSPGTLMGRIRVLWPVRNHLDAEFRKHNRGLIRFYVEQLRMRMKRHEILSEKEWIRCRIREVWVNRNSANQVVRERARASLRFYVKQLR